MDSEGGREAVLRQVFLLHKAQEQCRFGDASEGLRLIDQAIAAGPSSAGLWKLQGKCLERLGRHAEAAESYGRGRELGGEGSEDLVIWRADALALAGRAAEAVRLLRDYLTGGDSRPEVVTQAREALARYEARGEPGSVLSSGDS